ncbi:MAG: DNA-binding transcriptional MerR regulator [Gammaproteobacteria bacterium]|jgi:DNA-binding transcriptional MerR regulator
MSAIPISMQTYSIGELAREFEITSRALRLYEEAGLLNPERAGTRRIYSERNRVRLRLILRGKRLGWSLAEIKESFDLYDSTHGEQAQLELMIEKLSARRNALQAQKLDVEHALDELDRIQRNAQQALSDIRAVDAKPSRD